MSSEAHSPELLTRLLGSPGPEVTCEECFDLLDEYVDLELTGEDADRRLPGMREHLQGCPACREDHDSLRDFVRREHPRPIGPLVRPSGKRSGAEGANERPPLSWEYVRGRLADRGAGLGEGSPLRGRVAIANAQRAYARYRERFSGERWLAIERAGGHRQRPLWASTGTKDPSYSDVLYVERLIAPDVINTMPEVTLRAFADHGEIGAALGADAAPAEQLLRDAAQAGIDLDAITTQLERDGVRSFCDSYHELLARIETVLPSLAATR